MLDTLRGQANLHPGLASELTLRLARSRVAVDTRNVQSYVTKRFQELAPLYRAGVFQDILEGTTDLLRNAKFRRRLYDTMLGSFPTPNARRTFVDLWDAGLRAISPALRTLVLSVVMSESGTTGSPEQALVTLFSYSDPLTQKFGQALAFADLPRSYRTALQGIWDGAQKLDWWKAWQLIRLQVGDIRRAGYKLTRILNSGSTVAYLEITHEQTGQKRVLSVFRDGVERSVELGGSQLKTFARILAKRAPSRYGFLPLLVEDSLQTVSRELDRNYKREMTDQMASAYRRAAGRLGFLVTPDGQIESAHTRFVMIKSHELELDGKKVFVQDLADGESFKDLELRDPELYRAKTRELLALEAEVLRDPAAPVDKDRMPGQYVYNADTNVKYLLDHGQALDVDPEVHANFRRLTRAAFVGDVDGAGEILTNLTGVRPSARASLARRLADADVGTRPLLYLGEISAPFLERAISDSRRIRFFELLHAVRAELRVLQWEASVGLNDLSTQTREQVIGETEPSRLVWRTVLGELRRAPRTLALAALDLIDTYVPSRLRRRMDRAYRRAPPPVRPCADQLAEPTLTP